MIETRVEQPSQRSRRGFLITVATSFVIATTALVVTGATLAHRKRPKQDVARAEPSGPGPTPSDPAPYRRFAPRPLPAAVPEPTEPPVRQVTADEVREMLVKEVRESGPDTARWTSEATHALEVTLASAAPELSARFRPASPRCYRAGCMMDVVYTDDYAVRDLDDVMLKADSAVSLWPGTKHRSPISHRASGEIVGTWVLFSNAQSNTNTQGAAR